METTANVRLAALFELVRATGQYLDVSDQLDRWVGLVPSARMLGFRLLQKRVRCPSCGMNGASFEACETCGGPACDNCRNLAGRRSACSVCR